MKNKIDTLNISFHIKINIKMVTKILKSIND